MKQSSEQGGEEGGEWRLSQEENKKAEEHTYQIQTLQLLIQEHSHREPHLKRIPKAEPGASQKRRRMELAYEDKE